MRDPAGVGLGEVAAPDGLTDQRPQPGTPACRCRTSSAPGRVRRCGRWCWWPAVQSPSWLLGTDQFGATCRRTGRLDLTGHACRCGCRCSFRCLGGLAGVPFRLAPERPGGQRCAGRQMILLSGSAWLGGVRPRVQHVDLGRRGRDGRWTSTSGRLFTMRAGGKCDGTGMQDACGRAPSDTPA